jgi:hypothetical protein
MEWMKVVNGDPLSWLLEPEDIGVRYLTMRDLLDMGESDAEFRHAREEAYRSGPIRMILDAAAPEGYWERPGPGYNPKYRSTVWALILLGQLGASARIDPRVSLGCRYLLDHALTEHGQFTASGAPSGNVDCLQGNLCTAMLELEMVDPRLEKAFDWMARSVTGEGIAPNTERDANIRYYASNCGPRFACGSNLTHACAWGGVKVMLAFSKLPLEKWTQKIRDAVEVGTKFFFSVAPIGAEYPYPMANKPSGNWWKFGFPVFYVTDLLQLAEALVRLGNGQDSLIQPVIELILSKQDAVGRWPLEYDYAGKTWVDFGNKKQPNKWVTLRALRTLKLLPN